jgi:aminoglycoside 6'-N-acetyltransferase
MHVMASRTIDFRQLTRQDFADVLRWLREPHVAEWWTDPLDAAGVEREFGPTVDGTDATRVFVILASGRPVGLIQTYRLDDNPEYAAAVGVEKGAGVDLFVGDPAVVGGGFGSSALRLFLEDVVWRIYPDISQCMAGPSVRNLRSQRAFEKAGFALVRVVRIPGEEDEEAIMVATRPKRGIDQEGQA